MYWVFYLLAPLSLPRGKRDSRRSSGAPTQLQLKVSLARQVDLRLVGWRESQLDHKYSDNSDMPGTNCSSNWSRRRLDGPVSVEIRYSERTTTLTPEVSLLNPTFLLILENVAYYNCNLWEYSCKPVKPYTSGRICG